MRAAYYAATLLEIGGGLEKYYIETARDLSEMEGIQADVFTMDDEFNLRYGKLHNMYFGKKFDPKLLYRESIESINSKLGKARYIKCRTFAELVQRVSEYDVMYSRNDITEPFFFKFVMRYRRVPPVIFGCHIPHIYPIAEKLHAKLHNFLFTCFLYNWMANGVTGFHVINNFTLDALRRQFPGKRVARIYHPFDFEAFAANAKTHPFKGRIEASKFNIAWAGRLVEQKGVADLVSIIDAVNSRWKEKVAWHICGDGELKPLVEACASRWQNVHAWGHVSNLEMANVYSQCRLFITTSKWEGYPYNVLESQALALPVVSYDISGCNDMIEDGVNGLLVRSKEDFSTRVGWFLEGNQLPGRGATLLRERIDRKKIYRDMLAFFAECAADKRHGRPARSAGALTCC